MGDIQVRRLPVINRNKRLVGIIALGDIARIEDRDGKDEELLQISQQGGQHEHPEQGPPGHHASVTGRFA